MNCLSWYHVFIEITRTWGSRDFCTCENVSMLWRRNECDFFQVIKSLRMTEKAKTPYLVNNARIKPCTCMFLIKIVFVLPKFVIETHRKCKKIFCSWRKQQKIHFDFQWTSPSSRQPIPRRDQRSTNKPNRVYCKYGLVTKSRAFPIFASQYIYCILC